jgi:hypothetical protein
MVRLIPSVTLLKLINKNDAVTKIEDRIKSEIEVE